MTKGSEEEIIIRNGTMKQWLHYYVVFGGKQTEEYGLSGGIRIKGKYFTMFVALAFFALGLLF